MSAMRQRISLKQERAEKRERKLARKADQQLQKEVAKARTVQQLDKRSASTFVPSFSLLFRIISVVRIVGALTSPVQDCDEVYNYYEPLHFLQFGYGKQTWEYSSKFALRSYGYLEIYNWVCSLLHLVFGFKSKVQVFYALRIFLAVISAVCEATFVKAIALYVDKRIANYTVIALLGLAGMYHSASAFLPSSFAMYWCTLGSAASMLPPIRRIDDHLWNRTVPAILAFAIAAGCGWPYALIVAVPFALEEVLEHGVGSSNQTGEFWLLWRIKRVVGMAIAGAVSLGAVLGGLCLVDSRYYGHTVVAAWNQVAYNVLGRSGGGPDLYGTEPWYFYIKNGLVNANIIMVLALASFPLWIAYYAVLQLTVSNSSGSAAQSQDKSSSPDVNKAGEGDEEQRRRASAHKAAVDRLFTSHRLLLYRILPYYLVFVVFSLQPHKEERFMSIVYPHLCFNAAVSLSLLHPLYAWAEKFVGGAMGASASSRGRRAGSGGRSDKFNLGILIFAGVLGALRMMALNQYYSAPMHVLTKLPGHHTNAKGSSGAGELPLLPLGPSIKSLLSWGTRSSNSNSNSNGQQNIADEASQKVVCMGKDWYRFPSSYWLPSGYRLEFIQSKFNGQLPGSFIPAKTKSAVRNSTSAERSDFNGLNKWEHTHVVGSAETDCDYIIDVDFPEAKYDGGDIEMPFARIVRFNDGKENGLWRNVGCHGILDTERSSALARVVYVPSKVARLGDRHLLRQRWGQMCLFERQSSII
ncbi:mannosyltransferase [Dipsacomyces acuminosporus]|nr:mannosyltransferase [Dipsacomyces acuminosporus]